SALEACGPLGSAGKAAQVHTDPFAQSEEGREGDVGNAIVAHKVVLRLQPLFQTGQQLVQPLLAAVDLLLAALRGRLAQDLVHQADYRRDKLAVTEFDP